MAHAGSWFGLPDFGITERLSDIFQGPGTRTAQGGSNLLPSASNILNPYVGGGNVLGTSSQSKSALSSPLVNQSYQNMSIPKTTNPVSNGGGGGGGGSDLLSQWRALGNTGDLPAGWSGPTQNTGPSAEDIAREQARIELESALSSYDKAAEELQAQKTGLETQKTGTLNELLSGYQQSEKQAGTSKTEAESSTARAKNKALSTAQDVQKKNRNVLRALGILSSSAAGEMLGRPMEEYATQAADLEQGLVTRKGEIDTWLQDRLTEYNQAKTNIEGQYAQLIDNINRDLRFNERDRIQAVKAAQVAAQQAVQQAQSQAVAYQQAAQQYSAGILQQIAQLRLYQNPQANVSDIYNTMLSMASPTYTSQASMALSEEQKRKLSGLG